MKDHEVAALVNRLTQIAKEFSGTQQLRERIAREIRPLSQRPVAKSHKWVGLTDEQLADVWDKAYRQGIEDERTSEANIGIAGFGAKVEPARENPYRKALVATLIAKNERKEKNT